MRTPLGPIICHMNTAHFLISYFCNIYFNIYLTYTCSSWLVSLFRVSDQNFVGISHLSNVCYMPCPPPRLVNNNTKTNNYEAHCEIFTILLLLPPLMSKFSHTSHLFCSLRAKYHVSRPYETKGNVPNWVLPKYNAEMIMHNEAPWTTRVFRSHDLLLDNPSEDGTLGFQDPSVYKDTDRTVWCGARCQ
jgi:hypothetical protein